MQLTKPKIGLIAIALGYLALILVIPTISVFYEAFRLGIKPFLTSLQDSNFIEAVKLTVIIALITVPLNTIFGLCAAWVLARNQFPGRALFLSVVDLPFAISPVVAGLMIVLLYGQKGWIGQHFQAADIKIIFALPGMVIATIFVTLPFVAREVIPVLEEMGLLYGVLLTNARAMGEFGAVSVVSGNILGQTSTLPLFVEQEYKNYQTEAAFSAAVILALLAAVTLVVKEILERRTGRKGH
jgi:sulfate transport system permease protein